MNVKEAVTLAKKHVAELFADEKITHLGLEEVEFDEPNAEWRVTLGFSRPWDQPTSGLAALTQLRPDRSYKVIRVSDKDGSILAVKNREPKA